MGRSTQQTKINVSINIAISVKRKSYEIRTHTQNGICSYTCVCQVMLGGGGCKVAFNIRSYRHEVCIETVLTFRIFGMKFIMPPYWNVMPQPQDIALESVIQTQGQSLVVLSIAMKYHNT